MDMLLIIMAGLTALLLILVGISLELRSRENSPSGGGQTVAQADPRTSRPRESRPRESRPRASKPARRRKKSSVPLSMRFVFALVPLAMLAAGAAVLVMIVLLMVEYQQSANWPTTQGAITQNTIEYQTGRRGGSYAVTVKYSYNVNGRSYTSQRLHHEYYEIWGTEFVQAFKMQGSAQNYANQYPLNTPVTVMYDPDDPNNAIIERKFGAGGIGAAVAGVALLGVFLGGGGLYYTFKETFG